MDRTLQSGGPRAVARRACAGLSAACPAEKPGLLREVCLQKNQISPQVLVSSKKPGGIIHRVYEERIDHQDMAGLVEGAHHAPDEGPCKIHGCGNDRADKKSRRRLLRSR